MARKPLTILVIALAAVLGAGLSLMRPAGNGRDSQADAEAAAVPSAAAPASAAQQRAARRPSPDGRASEPTEPAPIDLAAWRQARQDLAQATSYRALIHAATSAPSLAAIAMAQRAFEACSTLAAWQARPERPHMGSWPANLQGAMASLQQRCNPPVADLALPLRHASVRIGYEALLGDAWLQALVRRQGLDALVRLGDGDVLALLGTQMDAATIHRLSPGLDAAQFSAAWVTLACERYGCDTPAWRLRACLHFDACSAQDLPSQLRAASGADAQQWSRARDAALALMNTATGQP